MRLINDIDKLYDINIRHHQTLRGGYVCPVCSKPYANEETFTKHLGEKNCYDLKAVVADTMIEDGAYKWYLEVVEEDRGRSIYNVSAFRKDRRYKTFVQTFIFCTQYGESRLMQFLAYMMLIRGYKNLSSAITNMRKESNLREFRMFLQKTGDIDDTVFVDQHHEDLMCDHHFLTRSLERADLSIHTFLSWDFEQIMEDMPVDYKERIFKIARSIE